MHLVCEVVILKVLQQTKPNKAPSPYGFTNPFYLLCLDSIKIDMTRMIQFVQKESRMRGNTKSSFLALIMKDSNASDLSIFRPISLCNVSYKIISNRIIPLFPRLIPPNQGGFVERGK